MYEWLPGRGFQDVFFYLIPPFAGILEITGALTNPRVPRPHPKDGTLETKKILTTTLLGLPFPVVKPL